MNIIAIDPGTTQSALIELIELTPGRFIKEASILSNPDLLKFLGSYRLNNPRPVSLAIEMIACYGMPVGKEVFETCVWIGRFIEAWGGLVKFAFRKDIKIELCGSMKAKDTNIRQVLIDIYGPPGTKKNPGRTYGIKKDMWAALAVAEYARRQEKLL